MVTLERPLGSPKGALTSLAMNERHCSECSLERPLVEAQPGFPVLDGGWLPEGSREE